MPRQFARRRAARRPAAIVAARARAPARAGDRAARAGRAWRAISTRSAAPPRSRCCSTTSARPTSVRSLRRCMSMMTLNALLGLCRVRQFDAALSLSPRRRRASRGHALDGAAGASADQRGADRRLCRLADGRREVAAAVAARGLIAAAVRGAGRVRRPHRDRRRAGAGAAASAPYTPSRRWRGRVSLLAAAAAVAGAAAAGARRARRARTRPRRQAADALRRRQRQRRHPRHHVRDAEAVHARPNCWSAPTSNRWRALRRHFGLEQGVENPFIRMTLYQGGC